MKNLSVDELLEIFPGGVVLYDSRLNTLHVSSFILKHTGLSLSEARKMNFYDFIHISERQKVSVKVDQFINSQEQELSLDIRGESHSIETHFVRMNLKRISHPDIAFISVGAVISDLVATNLRMKSQVLKLKKLESIAHIGVWEFDLENDSLSWSD